MRAVWLVVAIACSQPSRPQRAPKPVSPAPIKPVPVVVAPEPPPEPLGPVPAAPPLPASTPRLPVAPLRPSTPLVLIVHDTAPILDAIDRRGDYHLRHANVTALAISPDGTFGATGADDGTIVLWNLKTARIATSITTPHRSVWAVAVAAGGRRLASSGLDGTTRLWDVASGKQLWSSTKDADSLAFSLDGGRLAGALHDVERVWDPVDGKLVLEGRMGIEKGSRSACQDGVRGRVVTPGGRSIVRIKPVGCHRVRMGDVIDELPTGFAVEVTDAANPNASRQLGPFSSTFAIVAFSPKADRFAALDGRKLLVVDFMTGKQLGSVPLAGHQQPATRFAFASDARHVVMWNLDDIVVWDLIAGKEQWRDRFVNHPGGGTPARSVIAAGETWIVADRSTCVGRDFITGAVRWRRAHCTGAAVAEPRALLGRGASAVELVDTRTGSSLLPAPPATGPTSPITQLAVALDGRVAAGTRDARAWLWDATGGHDLALPPEALPPRVHFTAGGKLAVIAETRSDIVISTFGPGGAPLATTPVSHASRVGPGMAIAGDHLVVEEVRASDYLRTAVDLAGAAPPVQLAEWRIVAGMTSLHDDSLLDAAISRDLARVYVHRDGGIRLWNARTGRLAAQAPVAQSEVASLVLSRDERHVVAVYADGNVAVLDATTLAIVRLFAGMRRSAVAAISPDGKLVAAVGRDGMFVWQLADGVLVATVVFPRETPSALAFAPDGRTLWVGTTLGNLHRFSVK